MPLENKRMMMAFEHCYRKVNKAEIDPIIPTLTISQLEPVLGMVAKSRARYLKALFDLGGSSESTVLPNNEEVSRLNELRTHYEELLAGAQALQTAIEKGYVEVDVPRAGAA